MKIAFGGVGTPRTATWQCMKKRYEHTISCLNYFKIFCFNFQTRGSCYLFDCGTLEDFKCRFTPHTFYTSSVLQVNRNSFFLNEWKSQENQENELTGLKENVQLKTNLESNVVKAPDLSKTLSQTPAKSKRT